MAKDAADPTAEAGDAAAQVVPPEGALVVPQEAVAVAAQEAGKLIHQHTVGLGLQFGPPPHPLAAQVTPEHVTQSIAAADKQDERRHYSGRFCLVGIIVAFFFTSWLFLWYSKPELLEKILVPFLTFGAGAMGGYGYAKSKTK